MTTIVPIIAFKSEVYNENRMPKEPFKYTVYASRTDPVTSNCIWYVLELHVDSPAPEQTIAATTAARKFATVKIPTAKPEED